MERLKLEGIEVVTDGGFRSYDFLEKRVVTHPALKNLPFYLETPNELDGYAREIAMMREAAVD